MKKWITVSLATFIVFGTLVPKYSAAATPTENVIVLFKDDINETVIEDVNGEIEHKYNNIDVITGEVPVSAIDELTQNPEVIAVEIDQQVQISAQRKNWGVEKVNATQLWSSSITGKGIKVAVIDTGIAPHEDLHVTGGVSFVNYTDSYIDDNGHGTHVAGIIAAKDNGIGVVGVAPEASLYSVKVLDKEGNGYLSDIIAGIDWAVQNKMDIINLSLGAKENSVSLKKVVDKAYNNGILVVASAGNSGHEDGLEDTVEYPARYDSVIAVSAVDSNNVRSSFSATGTTVEIASPGVNILSTYLSNQYVQMSGTSMAAPFVTGILALLKEANPSLTHLQLRAKLQGSALDIGDVGRDTSYGFGLVQALLEEVDVEPDIQEVEKVQQEDREATIVRTGWIQSSGKWYYFDSNGGKKKGWLQTGGKWYYLDSNGVMKTGWQKIEGKWYYLDGSGAMKTGWLKTGGKWYYLDGSGAMKTGWLKTGGKWYYLDGSGAMKIGWMQTGNKWYYLDKTGAMITGWYQINGKWNYFHSSGVWVK